MQREKLVVAYILTGEGVDVSGDEDLYDSNTSRAFEILCQEYKLPVNQRWRYLQIGRLLENTSGVNIVLAWEKRYRSTDTEILLSF